MTETPHVHWKKLTNPDYLGAYALDGKDLTVKIVAVNREVITGDKGKKEECTVVHLDGQKPWILNVTNAKMIAKLLKTAMVDEWVGKSVTLYPGTTQLAGETVECLRVRPVLPTIKREQLTPDHPKWAAAVEFVAKGGDVETLRKKYDITDQHLTELKGGTQ